MTHLIDAQLLEKIIRKDRQALKQLYCRYEKRLAHFLLRMTHDKELVAEVINDVFFVVWEKASEFRHEAQLSTWLIGIAYRKALNAIKKEKKQTVPNHLSSQDNELFAMNTHETEMDIERIIKHLSPEQRAVMELTYFLGYNYKEIGLMLGCPENTIKTRMFYARKKLKQELNDKL